MSKAPAFFTDAEYQDRLLRILSVDPAALKQCASLLRADDFKPNKGDKYGRPRWIIAERVLGYFNKFGQPIGKLIRADVLDYSSRTGLGERQISEIEEYLTHFVKIPTSAPDAITEKIIHYKEDRLRSSVIEELVEAQASGTLTKEIWQDLSSKVLNGKNGHHPTIDYFDTLESRIEYRSMLRTHSVSKTPSFFIDPLDALIKGAGPGQLGLVIAPTGRGKSLFMCWLSIMFSLQRLNTLLITLEDPREEVENRLDAAVSGLMIHNLADMPKTLRARFKRFRGRHGLLQSRLHIVDGTEDGMTVGQIEEAVLNERNNGFKVDVILIDYDEELTAKSKQKEKRFEISDIYRDLRRLAARQNAIVWIAAQTQRGTEKLKVLSGDRVSEDLGKIRKSAVVLSLGQGEWGEESIYVWVAKHKFDRSHIGCTLVPDKSRMMLYDREQTQKASKQYAVSDEEDEEDL